MHNTLTMILAGGVGKRLSILSQVRAKPAVPFAGIYRIIDFTLSNVMNSGLSHVAVLPQYRPLSLMEHIGVGVPWDFNGRTRSINILPPSTGRKDSDWYRGTADAVRQNLEYIKNFDPEQLLILSGDHVYRMDYSEMIQSHRDKKADVTIGVIQVPMRDASQFGLAKIDDEGRIVEWQEKPAKPKTNLASMGIYVFSIDFIMDQLRRINGDDFGHNMIPAFVENHRVYGYVFNHYWRDVGTVQAYWESNMEIYSENSGVNLKQWDVATNFEEEGRIGDRSPAFLDASAKVSNSFIAHGCRIEGVVKNSVLSPGVHVAAGAEVNDSIILHNCTIGADSKLYYCIVDKNVQIANRCQLGHSDAGASHLCLIGKQSIIPAKMKIGKFCKVYPLTDLGQYSTRAIKDFQEVGESLL